MKEAYPAAFRFIDCLILTVFLSSCSGGGGGGGSRQLDIRSYTGMTDIATFSDENYMSLAESASTGASQAIIFGNDSSIPLLDSPNASVALNQLERHSLEIVIESSKIRQPGRRFRETVNCLNGTFSVDVPGVSANAGALPETGVAYYTASNCEFEDVVINGNMEITWTGGYSEFREFFKNLVARLDMTITVDGATRELLGTIICSEYGAICSIDRYFTDSNGFNQLINTSVSGNDFSGYTVSARVYIETHGYIDISGSNLTLCDNDSIGSGMLLATDSTGNNALQIDFTDCFQYVTTFNGVATTVNR